MNILRTIFLIVNPLLMAFVASVIIGFACKNAAAILMLKRVVSLLVFAASFMAYFYFAYVVQGAAMYIAMFAPLALGVVFVIISIISAPKEVTKEQSKKDFKMTGWDSMFPNDIDNK